MTLVNYLTDNYKKHPESNNAKLLRLVDAEINELAYVFAEIEVSRDIDRAKAMTLDKAGKNVLEYRGKQDDARYRDTIKIKIRAVRSAGDLLTVAEIAELLLGDTLLDVREAWNYSAYFNEPAAIVIRLKGEELRYIPIPLEKVVGGGIRVLYEINLGSNIEVKSRKGLWPFDYNLTNTLFCGTKPQMAVIGHLAKKTLRASIDVAAKRFAYKTCGTEPIISTLGIMLKQPVIAATTLKSLTFNYVETGDLLCGTKPITSVFGCSIKPTINLESYFIKHHFNYKVCGSGPIPSTKGHIERINIDVTNELETARFSYPKCGVEPVNAVAGKSIDNKLTLAGDSRQTRFPYPACGDLICGTYPAA